MRISKKFLVLTLILSAITTVSAQYGNGYNNGYGGGYGRNNSMSQLSQPSQPEKPKEIPADVTAKEIAEQMKTPMNLDELQLIAITNVLTETIREQRILMKQNYSQEEQIENFKALSENTDRKINQFLNPDQKEKYLAYKDDLKVNKKTKEKSKKKRKKE